jgi:predicted ATPase
MTTIEIRNIGPIKNTGKFDLNRVNVFMGPQSSGKSTIAKIISSCTWVEKDVATSQSLKTYQDNTKHFKEHIERFHKMKEYFRPDSYISYKSNVVEIKWENEECVIEWVDQYAYRRSKIAYIPSERNMVILPDVRKVELSNTNIRSFLFDWFDAREKYTKDSRLSILNLDVDYYFSESNIHEEDRIHGRKNDIEYDIVLSNASSGLQSITPLIAMIEYLTKWIYSEDKKSFYQEERQRKVNDYLIDEKILKPYFNVDSLLSNERNKKIEEYNKKLKENSPEARKCFDEYKRQREYLFNTQNSQFIIEEPEQNLFPTTQKDMIYHFLGKCLNKEDNRLTITTHSPYILYALNNCMLGYLVKEKMLTDDDYVDLKSLKSAIDPKNVSVWQITDEGTLNNIQGEDNLIEGNYFDDCMKNVMDDFYKMINYYGDEDED